MDTSDLDTEPDYYPDPVTVLPSAEHKITIIFLHGRGSSGRDFRRDLGWSSNSKNQNYQTCLPNAKWIFPSSPTRMSEVFHVHLREWFDICSLTDTEKINQTQIFGLRSSLQYFHDLIEREHQESGLPYSKIFLGGISQGCATSIHTFLTFPHRLGGFIGACGWIPFRTKLAECQGDNQKLATFYNDVLRFPCRPEDVLVSRQSMCLLMHSADDTLVDIELGWHLRDTVEGFGIAVAWIEWPDGGHWIKSPEGLDWMVEILNRADDVHAKHAATLPATTKG